MSQWDGKSKGTLLGYKIFVFLITTFGVKAAYSLLVFVSFYYFLFYPKSFKAIYVYLRERQKYTAWKAFWSVYRVYYVFGQTIIDKVAISAGLRDRFTYEFDGMATLQEVLADRKGGVLISAHVGNFEIAEKFLADIDLHFQINLVTVDQERTIIKEYIEKISGRSSIKYIKIKEDLSHVFEINDALSKNELICFTGDRYFDGSKTLEGNLLGKNTMFPAGPFHIASRLGVPVIFVYVMKEKNLHYHLYARRAEEVRRRDARSYLTAYTESVEKMLRQYPLQWFNFFDFWPSGEEK
ncbi:LpxL/LpxP family acyltransferase [Sphingobacterium griseoflavum]|uniref:Lipid A biosynthesis acyltransferase n=1 Tax=Sphingobacterium griseoflavum TaxID=1474952 RepID=A0ABQ3I037_9SPHI|nr:lipid A biosynthesis acyltransferase [Sphingobacterium griseoflavum]GHE40565.1 lipid A biosynthesis acyltransferase [Sphingobacterium griseoflavum]